jgi:hypothetical protein
MKSHSENSPYKNSSDFPRVDLVSDFVFHEDERDELHGIAIIGIE